MIDTNHSKQFYLLFLFSFFLLLVSSCREKEEKKSISENNETTEWAEKLPDKIDETTEWAEKLPDKIDGNYLQVIECYGYDGHPTYQEAFSDGEFVKNLKCFNEHLHDEYSYFELSFQSAQKIGYYNGDIDFVLDNDKTMFNQKIELNGRRTYVTTLKTVMIDFGISQILEEHIDIGSDKVVTSPLVGTFYSAPSPEADPFVQVGDTVKKGQVLGIIEAMKLMNEIECEQDGVISEILVKNGEIL